MVLRKEEVDDDDDRMCLGAEMNWVRLAQETKEEEEDEEGHWVERDWAHRRVRKSSMAKKRIDLEVT